MAFLNKNDAVSKLTSAITSPSDPKLQPSIGTAIKSGNLQNYIQNLLDWVFPPNPSLVDLRGKVLGVGRVPLTPITDYSSLEFMTMMPLGGIILYPLNGVNQNVGAGKVRAVLTPSSTQLDGFLFLDGLAIDTTISGNEIFKDLKVMLTGYYGNTMSDNLLRLPNMKRKVPICYDSSTTLTPAYNNPNIGGSENIMNYGQVSNTGGGANIILNTNQTPSHSHGAGSLLAGKDAGNNHKHYISLGNNTASSTGSPSYSQTMGYSAAVFFPGRLTDNYSGGTENQHTHNVTGNTSSIGGNQAHENRMEYMVLNYAIKY